MKARAFNLVGYNIYFLLYVFKTRNQLLARVPFYICNKNLSVHEFLVRRSMGVEPFKVDKQTCNYWLKLI